MKRRVLVVFPTTWDERQFAALPSALRARYELVFDQPKDAEVAWNLDVLGWIDARVRTWRGKLDGVFSSSDYPGAAVAAALAAELGLPGAPPAAVLRAGHKFLAREAQRAAAPEVVPDFARFDPLDEASWPAADAFPRFVKPVRGSFSLFARHVRDESELRKLASSADLVESQGYYAHLAEALAERYAPFARDARGFLAEEVLSGRQVTLEGWVRSGTAGTLGIVDSSFHPGTHSFEGFDLPSELPEAVQARMQQSAAAVALALGLDHTLFNVEFYWDPATDRIGLIELNPRLCGQFGDLYPRVGGRNGFELALALACGEELPAPRAAVQRDSQSQRAAASLPLRVFRSVRVTRAPGPAELRAAEALFPGTLVWSECAEGDALRVGATVEDGHSVRYAVVNLEAADRAELRSRLRRVEAALGFAFEPL